MLFTGVYEGGTTISNNEGSIDAGVGADYDFTATRAGSAPLGLVEAPPVLAQLNLATLAGEEEAATAATQTDSATAAGPPASATNAPSGNSQEPPPAFAALGATSNAVPGRGDRSPTATIATLGTAGNLANANGLSRDTASVAANRPEADVNPALFSRSTAELATSNINGGNPGVSDNPSTRGNLSTATTGNARGDATIDSGNANMSNSASTDRGNSASSKGSAGASSTTTDRGNSGSTSTASANSGASNGNGSSTSTTDRGNTATADGVNGTPPTDRRNSSSGNSNSSTTSDRVNSGTNSGTVSSSSSTADHGSSTTGTSNGNTSNTTTDRENSSSSTSNGNSSDVTTGRGSSSTTTGNNNTASTSTDRANSGSTGNSNGRSARGIAPSSAKTETASTQASSALLIGWGVWDSSILVALENYRALIPGVSGNEDDKVGFRQASIAHLAGTVTYQNAQFVGFDESGAALLDVDMAFDVDLRGGQGAVSNGRLLVVDAGREIWRAAFEGEVTATSAVMSDVTGRVGSASLSGSVQGIFTGTGAVPDFFSSFILESGDSFVKGLTLLNPTCGTCE